MAMILFGPYFDTEICSGHHLGTVLSCSQRLLSSKSWQRRYTGMEKVVFLFDLVLGYVSRGYINMF